MTLKDAYERLKWLSDQLKSSPMKEAIDTVLSSKNTEKKIDLDDRLDIQLIEKTGNQQIISSKKDRKLPTNEEIVNEANEIGEKEYWPIGRQTGFVFGAKWMRDLMRKEETE